MFDDTIIVDQFKATLPVDVFGMAGALGIRIQTADLPNSGTMTRVGKQWLVTINAKDGQQRQRFTLAHMIGHYMLHRDLMSKGVHIDRLYGNPSDNPSAPLTPAHEAQANRFAVETLMPLAQLRKRKDIPIKDMAAQFGVSEQALTIRLKSIGSPVAS